MIQAAQLLRFPGEASGAPPRAHIAYDQAHPGADQDDTEDQEKRAGHGPASFGRAVPLPQPAAKEHSRGSDPVARGAAARRAPSGIRSGPTWLGMVRSPALPALAGGQAKGPAGIALRSAPAAERVVPDGILDVARPLDKGGRPAGRRRVGRRRSPALKLPSRTPYFCEGIHPAARVGGWGGTEHRMPGGGPLPFTAQGRFLRRALR